MVTQSDLVDSIKSLAGQNTAAIALALLTVVLTFIGMKSSLRSAPLYQPKPGKKFKWVTPPQARLDWNSRTVPRASLKAHELDPTLLPEHASPSQKYLTAYDPATLYHIDTLPADSATSIDEKVKLCDEAQKQWKLSTFEQRRGVLKRILKWVVDDMEALGQVACRDSGKTMLDAAFGEILTTCSKIRWLMDHGEHYLKPDTSRPGNWILSHKSAEVIYEPLGVVSAMVSYNYPLHNMISPFLAALFSGNGCVVKCSEQVVWSSSVFMTAIQDIIQEAGWNRNIVQLVVCYPEEADFLTTHPLLKHITFIGSEVVARKVAVAAAVNLVPCTMELGGKDPSVLLPSADIKFFESTFMRAVFQSVGQGCIASERFIVHSSLVPKLAQNLQKRISELRLGSCLSSATTVDCGSMISPDRFDALERSIQQAVAAGAKVLVGGKRSSQGECYFEPTLIVGVTEDMHLAQEEVFAPIFLIMEYDTKEQAIHLANSTRYGLGASIFGNKTEAQKLAYELDCGMVALNDFGVFYLNQSMPFGGRKASGYGRFSGPEGLRSLCNVKCIMKDRLFFRTPIPSAVDFPLRSPQKGWMFVEGLIELFYGPWSGIFGSIGKLIRAG